MGAIWQGIFSRSLAVELLVASDLDDRLGGERIDDADADAVEAAEVE